MMVRRLMRCRIFLWGLCCGIAFYGAARELQDQVPGWFAPRFTLTYGDPNAVVWTAPGDPGQVLRSRTSTVPVTSLPPATQADLAYVASLTFLGGTSYHFVQQELSCQHDVVIGTSCAVGGCDPATCSIRTRQCMQCGEKVQ